MVLFYRFKYLVASLILSLTVAACEEVLDNTAVIVVSEEVVYISGETVRITGRILSLPSKGVDDRGYLIAEDENFANPAKVSLGPTDLPGRFITEYNQLSTGSNYFAKSYVEVDREFFYGSILNFSTLEPFVQNFAPMFGVGGMILTITGGNFTSDTKVIVGGVEAEILNIFFESKITLRMPPINTTSTVDIRVVVQGEELLFNQVFEYVVGLWKLEEHFITQAQLFDPVYFVDGNSLVVGLGRDLNTGDNSNFWKADLNTWQWDELTFTGSFARLFFFNEGFFGGGIFESGGFFGAPWVPNNEFWTYDSNSGSFVQQTDLTFNIAGGKTIKTANGFYLTGGTRPDNSPNPNIYFYDVGTQQWNTYTAAATSLPQRAIYFEYQDALYFIDQNNIWRYDIISEDLQYITTYPGDGDEVGIAEVIRDKVYVGLFANSGEIKEFDLTSNSWKEKTFFPGLTAESNSASWVYNDKIYVMRTTRTAFSNSNRMQIWTFEPDKF